MDFVVPAVEEYATRHTTPPGAHLDHVDSETREHLSAPQMMVGTLEGRFLEMLVFASGAKRVLEIGTFSGYSSIAMSAGLPEGGHITTCELDAKHAEFARRHIELAGLADRIDVRQGPALETIASLEGTFDLVFIDANKGGYVDYYEAVLPLLSERGIIAADNTLWSGRVVDEDDQTDDTVAIRRFNDHVLADPRTTVVQLTVRDGVTLIRKA
ncbi:MAG TPA: class I SAM-dependent methyltransferase [Acidimicrobiales bacterium]|nr:class I SAM-dependent methyltransferase [Acidimicrobiales bacterium]